MYAQLKTIKTAKNWIVTQDWITPYYTVKKGFISDGVTVPWVFRWYIHRDGQLFQAAILHDYLYKNAIKNKKYADKAFYDTAIFYKTNILKAKIAYFIVRIFGKGNYTR